MSIKGEMDYPYAPTEEEFTTSGRILKSMLDDMDAVFAKINYDRADGESIHDDHEVLQDAYEYMNAIHKHHKKAMKRLFTSRLGLEETSKIELLTEEVNTWKARTYEAQDAADFYETEAQYGRD